MNEADWVQVINPYYKYPIYIHKDFAKSVKVHSVYLFLLASQMLKRLKSDEWYGEVTGDVAVQEVDIGDGDICKIEKPFRYHLGFFKDGTKRVYGEDIPTIAEIEGEIR